MLRFVADLETNNNENNCRVWAAGIAEIPAYYTTSPQVRHWNNLEGLMTFLASQEVSHEVYFHNMKFDAQFIIDYLFKNGYEFDRKLSKEKTFRALITSAGVFYSLEICHWAKTEKNGKDKKTGVQRYKTKRITTKVMDSYKKIPLSVEKIANDFGLEIKKGSIDYDLDRPEGYQPTLSEIAYLENDIIIVARALSLFIEEGYTKMTLSGDAMKTFKEKFSGKTGTAADKHYREFFPRVSPEIDKYIRRAYKGGYTYVKDEVREVEQGRGIVLDVNSLYPSVMRYAPLPWGTPIKFRGFYYDELNKLLHNTHTLFIQEFTCSYKLKENRPAIAQIKGHFKDVSYSKQGYMENFCMTNIDLNLFFECYEVTDFQPLGGYAFKSMTGFFNSYIDYFTELKTTSKKEGNEGQYLLSKLFLNSLFGKFSVETTSFLKTPYMDKDGVVKYTTEKGDDKEVQYTAMSAFITAFGRQVLVNAIIANYDRWLYSDTDSIHLSGWDMPEGMFIDDSALGAWKLEGFFERSIFLKSKCYIEAYHKKLAGFDPETGEAIYKNVTSLEELELLVNNEETELELDVKCAGMTDAVKEQVTFDNFKVGSTFSGKKFMKTVAGGRVIEEGDFTIN